MGKLQLYILQSPIENETSLSPVAISHRPSKTTYRKHEGPMEDLLERHFSIWSASQMYILYRIRGEFGVRCGISG